MAPKELVQVAAVVVEEESIYAEWMPALEEGEGVIGGATLIANGRALFSEEEEEERGRWRRINKNRHVQEKILR